MSKGQTQRLEQRQKTVMSQQLQQAVKMLQVSNLELNDYLRDALESNPFLEANMSGVGDEMPLAASDPRLDETPFEDYTTTDWSTSARGNNDDDDFDKTAALADCGMSLHEHLRQQLMMTNCDLLHQAIGLLLIDAVSPTGYLAESLEELAARANIDMPTIERVHAMCTTFDPTGVFARSPAECLALQLKERQQYTPAMAILLDNLPELARRDKRAHASLAHRCGISLTSLETMLATLRQLNPKPGHAYTSEAVQTVIPDVVIRQVGQEWRAELNYTGMPKVSVNQGYYHSIKNATTQDAFIKDCYKNATWLVNCLDRREKTIVRVANEIAIRQRGFFEKGVSELRPMILKDVAEVLELHESTISRVTGNKYLRCPRGIFSMRFFFMSGLTSSDNADEVVSSQTVKHRIKTLIDRETAETVLSDDDLVKKLNMLGVQIARRTVTKYREALGIKGSRERKSQLRDEKH